jgi:hypothetical protein
MPREGVMNLRSRIGRLERRQRTTGENLDVLFQIPDNGRDGLLARQDLVRCGCLEIYRYRGADSEYANGMPAENLDV